MSGLNKSLCEPIDVEVGSFTEEVELLVSPPVYTELTVGADGSSLDMEVSSSSVQKIFADVKTTYTDVDVEIIQNGNLVETDAAASVIVRTIKTGEEEYDGDYIVTPETISQKLETKNRIMSDDVTVLAIPFFETTNLGGGYTAIIGGS